MDDSEDDAKSSGYSAHPEYGPCHEALDGQIFRCNQKAQSVRTGWHKNDSRKKSSSTATSAREFIGATRTTKTRPRSDSAQNLSGMSYGHRTRAESPRHFAYARSDVRAAGKGNRRQGPESAIARGNAALRRKNKKFIFHDKASVRSSGKMQERYTGERLKDDKESSSLYTDNSSRIKQFLCGYQTGRQARGGEQMKGNCSSEQVNAHVNGQTCKSKEDIGNRFSEKMKAPVDGQTYKSKEDMGNRSSEKVKAHVNVHTCKSKEDMENHFSKKVKAYVNGHACKSREDMGNCSSGKVKAPVNGQTCKSTGDIGNHSSEKVKATVNGQSCKSIEDMRNRSSERLKAHVNGRTCESKEDMGNRSSDKGKAHVNGHTCKSTENMGNRSSDTVKTSTTAQACKSKEDMGNCSSEKVKAPVNGQTCKLKEDIGNHSSEKVKARANGATYKSKKDMGNRSSGKGKAPVNGQKWKSKEDMGVRSSEKVKAPVNEQTWKSKEDMGNLSSERAKEPVNGRAWKTKEDMGNRSSDKRKAPVNRQTCKSKEDMGNHSSEKMKAPVNEPTCKSKENIGHFSSERVKAHVNGRTCKSKEDMGNRSAEKVKAPVNGQTCKAKEDMRNLSLEKGKAHANGETYKSKKDMGNRSSGKGKAHVNGYTCKLKEDMGNRSSYKVTRAVNGQACKSKEDMKNSRRRNAPSECGDSPFVVKSNSEANLTAPKREQEQGNVRGRRRNRGGRGRRSRQMSDRVMINDFAVYEKPEKDGRNDELVDDNEDHQTTSTGGPKSNTCHETSQSADKPVKNRRKTFKKTAENCKALSEFGAEDVDESFLTKINEKIRSLLEQDPSQMCKVLSKEKKLLKNIIQISCNDQELLINVIALLQKALSSRFSQHAGYALIIVLKDTSFFESAIVPFLSTFLAKESLDWSQHLPVLKNIISLALMFFSKTPTSMYLIFGLLEVLQRIGDNLPLNETTDTALQGLKDGIIEIQAMKESQVSKRMTKSMTHRVSRAFLDENKEPPDNFRNNEVYPQLEEFQADKPPFFRMNKETGGYNDLEHYLDVQYRLLREDFICPLREGIREYKENIRIKKKKLHDLRLYYDVKIQRLVPGRDGIHHRLEFNVSHLRHVEWDHSKRLLYGSFLCLSSDNFETMLFATVADRDPRELTRGIVSASFQTDFKDVMKRSHQTFVMAESIAFFEAYKHVLFGLQNVIGLPFQKHLVNCEKDVDPPIYLSRTDSEVYDLEPLLDRTKTLSKSCRITNQTARQQILGSKGHQNIHVLSLSEWPSANNMGLDRSQYKAIQTALTHGFSITQGPPGTGKTYIGLQIVRVLLHNRHVWDENPDALLGMERSPMLIVCYTNHALDQFLEGIVKFYTGDIVRVGGRSSSEGLKEHHLDKFRERFRRNRLVPSQIKDTRIQTRRLVNQYMMQVEAKAKALEQTKQRILLTEQDLYYYMQNLYDSLIFGFLEILWRDIYMVEEVAQKGMQSWVIHEWLGCGFLLPRNDENVGLLQNMNNSDANVNAAEKDDKDSADYVSEDVYVNVIDVADAMEAEDMCVNGIDEADTMEADRVMTDDGDDFLFELSEQIMDEAVSIGAVGPKTQFGRGETANEKAETDEKQTRDGFWQISKREKKKRKKDLKKQLLATSVMGQEQVDNVVNVWELDYKDRWCLYRYWRQLYLNALEEDFVRHAKLYEDVMKDYKEARMREDQFVLQHAQIIGMTTTCAARYQSVLQKIGPRIIIVEEAAEVLESHVITTLSEHCQHLILIGDHKQLRPNPTTYALAKDYNLDISLFERMVNNGIQCDCLEEQHRMRPEISMLLRHIYPNLRDHVSVTEYEHIKGVGSDVFFIDHTQEESACADQNYHLSEHEARYVVALCWYLLQQGYSPNQITVLTTYSGQLFCLRNMMPKSDFNGVKVTVVDNYQGEENDIILLSLVRSNREGKIGFLKISNRICVALSRAKKGLYVIGNFDFLASHSELWKNIVEILKKEKRLGEGLPLYCQNHPTDGFKAVDAYDFEEFAPDGGCKKECKILLKCAHFCNKYCHPDDKDHEKYQCQEPCERLCERGHSCKKRCYMACMCMVRVAHTMTGCGHVQHIPCYLNPADFKCKFPVSRTLPRCGHTATIECWKDPIGVKCPMPCEKRLRCGHICQEMCGEMHTTDCFQEVVETLECGHKVHLQCWKSKAEVICREKCTHMLICGHACHKMCREKHDNDQYCKQMVTRIVPGCEHTVQTWCSIPVSELKCDKIKEVKFNCGHTSKARCGQESSQKCNFMMKKTFECGHISDVPCHRADSFNCQEKCDNRLVCGHQCAGDCTECFKGRLHKRCSVPNVEVLICGHVCTVLCSYCPSCEKKCQQKCPHKTCMKGCSEVCEPCKEPCTWSCPHFKCTKTCSEICNRPPCNEPCMKNLRCEHSCIGICGEPCPTLCRICDKEKVTKRRFGTETNPKSKFVQLCDCGDVVEVTAMDRWMQQQIQQGELSEIRFPICPCCRTPIRNSVRYQRELNKIRRAIGEVKSQLWSSERRDQFTMDDLISTIKMLEFLFNIKSKVELEKQISEAFKKSVDTFKKWVLKQKDNVTPQQQLDIRDELTRLQLMLKLIIISHENMKANVQLTWDLQEAIESARTVLLSGKRLGNNRVMIESCLENLARLSTSSVFNEPLMIYNANLEVRKEWSRGTWMTCAAGHVFRKVELINRSCPSCMSTVRETAV